jgi:hypothetical protein
MTLARRVGQLERIEEDTRRRPMRERVYRILERLGGELGAEQVEALVTRYAGAPERIRRWRSEGLLPREIETRLLEEV